MSDSVWPHRWQPTRLPLPWDSPGKNTGVGWHLLHQCRRVKSESEVTQSCPTLHEPMDCCLPDPPPMGFSRQEYWSGLPLPYPKWTGIVEFNSDDNYIYYWGQESFSRNWVAIIINKRVQNAVLGCSFKNNKIICSFPKQTIHYHSDPSLCPDQ